MASIVVNGDTSGSVTLSAPATAGTVTVTLPATSGTMLTTASSTGISGSAISSGTVAEAYGGTGTNTGYYGFKNRIINGAMVIDQRNAGSAVTLTATTASYITDRWYCNNTSDAVLSVTRDTSAPSGFTNSTKVTVSTADASIGATQNSYFAQWIEGYNSADLAWGTASASTVTLSFWVRSSLTGTFGGALTNSAINRSYPFTYSISSANTWEQKSITVSGDTSGTWLTDNGVGLRVWFALGTGSTYLGTAGAWAGAEYRGATGQTQVISTVNATWAVTGVQLEKGSTATSFDYRPYTTELQLCQRYYCRFNASSSGAGLISIGWAVSTTATAFSIAFPVTMRTPPTALEQSGTAANYQIVWAGAANALTSVPTFGGETTVDRTRLEASIASVLTTGMALGIRYASTSAYLAWSAEL